MKRIILTIISVLAFSGAYAVENKWETDCATKNTTPTSGSWTYNYTKNTDQALENQRRVNCILAGTTPGFNGKTKTVKLTGDIMIRYSVFVGLDGGGEPTTLIIENGTDRQVTIWDDLDNNQDKYHADKFGTLFSVWDNCTLIIRGGGKGKEIIIGGNYNHRTLITNYGFLESTGNLILEHTIVEHVGFNEANAKAGECSLIKLHPWGRTFTQGQTKLTNVELRNITMPGGVGSIMYCYDATQNLTANTSSASSISLTDVHIHDVTQGGTAKEAIGNGGLIRFIGEWVGNLNLTRVKFEKCTSGASSAGVYWNALGRPEDPCWMTVDNCTFDNCRVTDSGQNAGAMLIEGRARFIGGTTTFQNCSCPNYGGALYIHNYSGSEYAKPNEVFEYDLGSNLSFKNNSAAHGGGVTIRIDDGGVNLGNASFKITINGATFESNSSTAEGGALKIDYGANKYGLTLNLNSGTFNGNSSNNGGAIYSYKANVSYSSGLGADAVCKFSGNTATTSGSAMYINQAPYFNMKTVEAYENTCTNNDGVIYLINSKMTMDNGKIYNNSSAGWGCGIYMRSSTLTIQNGEITDNTCKNRGGGIHMQDNSTLTINNGKINNNHAENQFGGGVCAIGNSSFTMKNGEINGNTAKTNGGGVYIEGSSFSMENGSIDGNTAGLHGGGICFFNNVDGATAKTFKFGGGSISNNKSGGFGGGVCLYTGSVDGSSFSLTGGNINGNKAEVGGGIYLNGWSKYQIGLINTNVESNSAYLGGGVLVYNCTLNYKNGFIRHNKANKRGSTQPTTMYHTNHSKYVDKQDIVNTDLSGIGGGIYSTNGTVRFDLTDKKFGLYNNLADYGADDIFSTAVGDGNSVSMQLPDPNDMDIIDGFDVPKKALFWAEDYVAGDSNFDQRPSNAGAGPNRRYRDLLYERSKDLANAKFQPGIYPNYIMAALGYNFVYGTLKKSGLKKGETTIINIYRGDISTMDGAKPYAQVPLTGDENGNAERTILLQPGKWTVVESTWSWTYKGTATGEGVKTVDGQPAMTRELIETSDLNLRTFSFTNEKQKSAPNAESIKKNNFSQQEE